MLMIDLSPTQILSVAGALLAVAVLTRYALRSSARARSRKKQRIVERPNSHYTAPVVRQHEDRDRWRGIDLGSVHEINRAEVARLLGKVEAAGADSLRPAERTFLDHLAGLAAPQPPREPGVPTVPRDTIAPPPGEYRSPRLK